MPGIHKVDLVGQDIIAADLGVTFQAVSNWYSRRLPGLPKPIEVMHCGERTTRVWRDAQRSVWKKWHEKHLAAAKGRALKP